MTLLDLAYKLEAAADVIRTPYRDGGHMVWHMWGAGPPLVLLHGGSGSWTHWLRNIEALSDRYRLIVADMPGLGDSDMPPEGFDPKDYPTSVPQLATHITAGIDDILGTDAPFRLCGFSFGSIAGAYVAAAGGTRLQSYTLVGSSAFGWPWDGLRTPFLSMSREMSEAQRLEVQRANLSNAMMTMEVGDDTAAMQLANVERARVRSHGVTQTDTIQAGLAKVGAPLNGIWGREDIFAQPNLQRIEDLLRGLDPGARFEIIDGAGHWVMYDAPEAFNTCLLRVLEERSTS